MSFPHRQLSSLASLQKLFGESLSASRAPAATNSLEVKLNPRPCYPIKLAIMAEELQQVSASAGR